MQDGWVRGRSGEGKCARRVCSHEKPLGTAAYCLASPDLPRSLPCRNPREHAHYSVPVHIRASSSSHLLQGMLCCSVSRGHVGTRFHKPDLYLSLNLNSRRGGLANPPPSCRPRRECARSDQSRSINTTAAKYHWASFYVTHTRQPLPKEDQAPLTDPPAAAWASRSSSNCVRKADDSSPRAGSTS